MNRRAMGRRALMLLGVPLLAVGSAHGQLNDGNMDALAVGTPPDCTQAAGAWVFPPSYQTTVPSLCEIDPNTYTIVATGSFDPTRTGNSLRVNLVDIVANLHLTNILTAPITPAAGQIVRVQWELYVGVVGGGATAYVGADMTGTAGYSNATDRGPQLSWTTGGEIQYARFDPVTGAGQFVQIVPVYPRSVWQTARVDIHLDTQNFDFYWGPTGQPLTLIQSGLAFRLPPAPTSPPINRIDRFSIAHFGPTPGLDNSNVHYDNITIALISPGPICYPDCNGDHALNVNDFICFQGAFAGNNLPLADCNHDTVLNVNDFICFQSAFAAGCSQL